MIMSKAKKHDFYDKMLIAFMLLAAAAILGVSHFHEMASYNETDFYGSYACDAQNILQGKEYTEPDHGPGYVLVLAITSLLFQDMFLTGKAVSIFSSLLIILFTFKLVDVLFNKKVAFYTVVLLFLILLPFSILVKSDIFFAAVVIISIYFFYSKTPLSYSNLFWSGLVAGYAFITRYNAIFLPISVALILIFLNPDNDAWNRRMKGLLVYSLAFFLVSVPWWIFNYFHAGGPMSQSNYLVVAMTFYGSGTSFGAEEKVLAAAKFNSLFSVISFDFEYFAFQLIKHIVKYFQNALTHLVKFPLYLFFAPGLILLLFNNTKKIFSLLVFPVLGFLILTLVQFWPRFYLYIAPFFIFVPVYFIFREDIFKQARYSYMVFSLCAIFLLYYSVLETKKNVTSEPTELIEIAQVLRHNRTDSDVLIARKPHLGFLSNINTEYFPEVDSLEALLKFAKERNATYLLYSDVEEELRPKLRILQQPARLPENLQLIYKRERPKIFLYKIN